jgi:hypothetical protein
MKNFKFEENNDFKQFQCKLRVKGKYSKNLKRLYMHKSIFDGVWYKDL